MTTEIAFDLFLDEHEAILDSELFEYINNTLQSKNASTTRLSVVKYENSENEIIFDKANSVDFFKNRENEKPEIKKINDKGSLFQNQNVTIQSEKYENPKNEIEFSQSIKKRMMFGYMNLLSN